MKPLKRKWMSVPIMGLCWVSMASFSFAATNSAQLEEMQQMRAELKNVKQEAQALKEDLMALRAEMQRMKQTTQPKPSHPTLTRASKKLKPKTSESEGCNPPELICEETLLAQLTPFPTVTTSPYLGLQSSYDGSDLVVNVSSMGEDLRLLKQRQALAHKIGSDLAIFERRPVLIISGKLEPTVWVRRVVDNRRHRSDIDLDSSELDFLAEASSSAFGFLSVAYDNQGLDRSLVNSPIGRRISNSRIYLKRGFITLGDLDKYPFYFSAGQMYTDFGRYSSNMISSTLPSKIGRTNARQLHLGYMFPSGLSASTYLFRGDTHTGHQNRINEGGVNLRYKKEFEKCCLELGAGYISNVANSDQMQVTGLPAPRQGFAFTKEFLFHRVPAFNTYGALKLGPWKVVSEYVGAVRAFDFRNFTINGLGAQPKAMQVGVGRDFELFNKPSLIGFSYDHSWEAYALGLPKDTYGLVFSTVPLKNVRFTLEYRYSNEYPKGTTGYIAGSPFCVGVPGWPNCFTTLPCFWPYGVFGGSFGLDPSKGKHINSLVAQLGLYF